MKKMGSAASREAPVREVPVSGEFAVVYSPTFALRALRVDTNDDVKIDAKSLPELEFARSPPAVKLENSSVKSYYELQGPTKKVVLIGVDKYGTNDIKSSRAVLAAFKDDYEFLLQRPAVLACKVKLHEATFEPAAAGPTDAELAAAEFGGEEIQSENMIDYLALNLRRPSIPIDLVSTVIPDEFVTMIFNTYAALMDLSEVPIEERAKQTDLLIKHVVYNVYKLMLSFSTKSKVFESMSAESALLARILLDVSTELESRKFPVKDLPSCPVKLACDPLIYLARARTFLNDINDAYTVYKMMKSPRDRIVVCADAANVDNIAQILMSRGNAYNVVRVGRVTGSGLRNTALYDKNLRMYMAYKKWDYPNMRVRRHIVYGQKLFMPPTFTYDKDTLIFNDPFTTAQTIDSLLRETRTAT